MRKRSEFRLILGVLIWIGLGSCCFLFARQLTGQAKGMTSQLARYLTTRSRFVEVEFEDAQVIRVGDPVFAEVDGRPQVIGRIYQVDNKDSVERGFVYTSRAFLEMNNRAPALTAGDHFTFHETPDNIGWVIETMLPDTTRKQITKLITEAYRAHHREIAKAFQPLIEETLREAAGVIGEDLTEAMKRREQEFVKLGNRFKTELLDEKIVPLIRKEIWPIVRVESEPILTKIGHELWREISIWRFTWRAIYDSTPFNRRSLTQREFQRFFENKAAPILESHVPELIRVQRNILNKVAKNKQVEKVVSDSLRSIASDAELQGLMSDIFQEVFLSNERLKTTIHERWTSPAALNALETANRRLDPTVVKIGALLFGAIDEEIADDFSAVLRNRIMRKDNRWLVLVPGVRDDAQTVDGPLVVRIGSGKEIFPGRLEHDWLKANGRGGN